MTDYTDIILKKLKETGRQGKVQGDWVMSVCHMHNDSAPSFGINIQSGIGNCFSCGGKTPPSYITDDLDEDDEELAWRVKYTGLVKEAEEVVDVTLHLPPNDHNVTDPWRSVSAEVLRKLGVYYCSRGKYAGRNVFPIVRDGEVLGFDARVVDDTARMQDVKWIRPKGMKARDILYPYDYLKENFEDLSHIVLTEGIMDAVSYLELKVPAFPSFGLAPPSDERIARLLELGVERLTIGYDNDDAGRAGALKVYEDYAAWFDIVPHQMVHMVAASGSKDANEFLEKMRGVS